MSIMGFAGPAGCGKTHSVVGQLRTELLERPLLEGQRVLALTFMHGARHRLDEQLGKVAELKGNYDASTLDSFAWRICRRWRGRVRELGLPIPDTNDFDANCATAAILLGYKEIRSWVSVAYPIILIDEAQDLEVGRLGIIDELGKVCCVLLAFDEFQCLNHKNRPVAIEAWITGKCELNTLTGSKRTYMNDLLLAARQIRGGEALSADGQSFKVIAAPARGGAEPTMAAAWIGQRMRKGGSFAILAQSHDNSYVSSVVELLRTKPVGKNKDIGPFSIAREGQADSEVTTLSKSILAGQAVYTLAEIEAILQVHSAWPPVAMTLAALRHRRNARGTTTFEAKQIVELLDRQTTNARQHTRRRPGGRRALTIHQAKNREFDHVAVIWPHAVGGNDDDRRRLLYNAITRAKLSCLVVVQDARLLKRAPFA